MQILVIAATEMEIAPFRVNNPGVETLITGVGVPATIYRLLKKLQQTRYDLVIQAGIGGTFSTDIAPLGSTVIVQRDVFADLGIEEQKSFSTLFESGFAGSNDFPFKGGQLENNYDFIKQLPLRKVGAITVNKVSDDSFQSDTFLKKYDAAVESMEGAALHYVCLNEEVPFLQLRSISNQVGERDKARWQFKHSIAALNENLKQIVNGLLVKEH